MKMAAVKATLSGWRLTHFPTRSAGPMDRAAFLVATHDAYLPSCCAKIRMMKNDASGITAKAPCYFECRFIGPNAIGTWPAFWLMTDYMTDHLKGLKVPCDELDIIEAYGGEGHGHPNAFDSYMICPHAWEQGESGKAIEKKAFDGLHNPIRMRKLGIPSAWFEAFHTYGCKITEKDTIYYCDDIEVGRHESVAGCRAGSGVSSRRTLGRGAGAVLRTASGARGR
jgi:hypothetical protein